MAIKWQILTVSGFIGVLIFFFLIFDNQAQAEYQLIEIEFDNRAKINAFLADDFSKQQQGLAVYDQLEPNQGMLFKFNDSRVRHIWMKDMNFAIDLIWLDEEKKIIKIEENIGVDSYPETFSSGLPVKYFIETNTGWVKENQINTGQHVYF